MASLFGSISLQDNFTPGIQGITGALGQLGLVGALGAVIKAASDDEDAIAQLDAALKSTADNLVVFGTKTSVSNHMAGDSYVDLAYNMESMTKYQHNAVLGAENMLLTFRTIGQDVFPETTQAVLDISQAMGQDLKSSAIQVGKALDDPVKGMGALARVGVMFTEDQKNMIKQLEASGNHLGAQKIILGELEKEFGNSAEAAGKTFSGQLAIAGNLVGDLAGQIGNYLLPSLTDIVTGFKNFVQSLNNANPQILQAIAVALALGAALVALPIVLGAIGGVIGAILSPIGLVVIAIGALYLAWQNNFGGIQGIVMGVYNTIKPIITDISNLVSGFVNTLTGNTTQMVGGGGPQGGLKKRAQPGDDDGGDGINHGGQGKTAVKDMDLGARLAQAISDAQPKVTQAINDLITIAVKWIKDNGPALLQGALTIMLDIGSWIGTQISTLTTNIKTWIVGGTNWLIANGPALLQAALIVLLDIKTWIGGQLAPIGESMRIWLAGATAWIVTNGPPMIQAALQALFNLGSWIATQVPIIAGNIGTWLAGGLKWITDNGPKVIGDAITSLLDVTKTVNGKQPDLLKNIQDWINNAIKWITTNGPALITGALSIILDVGNFPLKVLQSLLQPIIDEFMGPKGMFQRAIDGAKTIIQGLKDIFPSIGTALSTAVSNVANTLMQPFKDGMHFIGNLLIQAGSLPLIGGGLKAVGQQLVALEQGGPASAGMPYLVGEKGPELFIPTASGTVIPNNSLKGSGVSGTGAGGVIQQMIVNIYDSSNPVAIWNKLEIEAARRNVKLGAAV